MELAWRSSTMGKTPRPRKRTEAMMLIRRILSAALVVGALLGATAPGASASTLPTPAFGFPPGALPSLAYAWNFPVLGQNVGAVGAGSGGICGSSSASQGGGGSGTAGGKTAQGGP